jgi:hypothetical protein
VRPHFVFKWIQREPKYVHEKRLFCLLRKANNVQRLLYFDDSCQILVIENVLGDLSAPVGTGQVLQWRSAHGRGGVAALLRKDAAALDSLFATFAEKGIFPNDLSTCCNVFRTSLNGTLKVIDFGGYVRLAPAQMPELTAMLTRCKGDVLLSLKELAGVHAANIYQKSKADDRAQRCGAPKEFVRAASNYRGGAANEKGEARAPASPRLRFQSAHGAVPKTMHFVWNLSGTAAPFAPIFRVTKPRSPDWTTRNKSRG